MYRKDYDELGAAIRRATLVTDWDRHVVRAFVEQLAAELEQTNSYFDRQRFLKGAGFPQRLHLDPMVEAMAERYAAGASLRQVREEFGGTAWSVSKLLREAGVTLRKGGPSKGQPRPPRNTPPDAETVQAMADCYVKDRETLAEIGQEFGYHAATVAQHLRDIGVEIRPKSQPRPLRNTPPDIKTVRAMADRYVKDRETLTKIGQEFGYHAETVAEHLRSVGVSIRRRGRPNDAPDP